MLDVKVLIFILRFCILMLTNQKKLRQHHHRHSQYHLNADNLEELELENSFIQNVSVPLLDLKSLLEKNFYNKVPDDEIDKKIRETKLGSTNDKDLLSNTEDKKEKKEKNDKNTANNDNSDKYSKINKDFIDEKKNNLCKKHTKLNEELDDFDNFSFSAMNDIDDQNQKALEDFKKGDEQNKDSGDNPRSASVKDNKDKLDQKPNQSTQPLLKDVKEPLEKEDKDLKDFKEAIKHIDIFKPYNYSKKTYGMTATENTLSERLKDFNGKKSINKNEDNLAIAKSDNGIAVAKGKGAGRAISKSGEGSQATSICMGEGSAIADAKNLGTATAVSYDNGKAVSKSLGGFSEAVSKGAGNALAVSSDSSFSRAIAIGNANSTALSSDNAIAISKADSRSLSDSYANKNSTALSNSTSRANSLSIATDNSFSNSTALANSFSVSTATNNAIANSNADSDAQAIAKSSGNGISQVLANANSQAIAESKDNSVVIVEANSNSKATGDSHTSKKSKEQGMDKIQSTLSKAASQDVPLIKAALNLNKNKLKESLQKDDKYPSFIMIKKIQFPYAKNIRDQDLYDFFRLNLMTESDNTNSLTPETASSVVTSKPEDNSAKVSSTEAQPTTDTISKEQCAEKANNSKSNETTDYKIDNTFASPENKEAKVTTLATDNNQSANNSTTWINDNQPTKSEGKNINLTTENNSQINTENTNKILSDIVNNATATNIQLDNVDKKLDISKIDSQSAFVKEIIKKFNNEDCVLNYDAGPIFNSIIKNQNENKEENKSINTQNASEIKQENLTKPAGEEKNPSNTASEAEKTPNECSQPVFDLKKDAVNKEDNKAFLMQTPDVNQTQSSPVEHKDKDILIDKKNNVVHINQTNGDNKNIKIDQQVEMSRNKVNRQFNSENSDYNVKNTIEHVSGTDIDKEDKNKPDAFAENNKDFYDGSQEYPFHDSNFDDHSYNENNPDEYQEDEFRPKISKRKKNKAKLRKHKKKNNIYEDNNFSEDYPTINGDNDLHEYITSEKHKALQQQKSNKRLNDNLDKINLYNENQSNDFPPNQILNNPENRMNIPASIPVNNKLHNIWTKTDFKAIDIACSNKGDIMAIGEDKKLYKYDINKNLFEILSQEVQLSGLKNIDLGPEATPFVVTENGNTYFLDSKSRWIKLPGCSTEISIGKHGEIYKLGCTKRKRGYSIYKLKCFVGIDGNPENGFLEDSGDVEYVTKSLDFYLKNYFDNLKCEWETFPGYGRTIIVGNDGYPYIISMKNNFVYKYDGIDWDAVSGIKAKDISISNEDNLFLAGLDGKIYKIPQREKDADAITFDCLEAEKISTGPFSSPSIVKSKSGFVYTASKI